MSDDGLVCYAPGDKCPGCDHYYGRAAACKYKGIEKTDGQRIAELEADIVKLKSAWDASHNQAMENGAEATALRQQVEAMLNCEDDMYFAVTHGLAGHDVGKDECQLVVDNVMQVIKRGLAKDGAGNR